MRFPSLLVSVPLLVSPALIQAQSNRLEAEQGRLEGTRLQVVSSIGTASIPAQATPARAPASGYSGSGYVTGFGDAADRLSLTYVAPVAGIYDLAIGYLCPKKCAYELAVNDIGVSGQFAPRTPGSFEAQKAGKVELKAGANTLVFHNGWGNYDLDYIELAPSSPIVLPLPVTTPPSDPQATPEARALLQRLDVHYGHGTMMGVYSDEDAKYVFDTTGFHPAIMGADLSSYSPTTMARKPHPSEIVERMIAHAREGYLLTFSWHWVPPFGLLNRMQPAENGKPPVDARWNRGFYTEATTFDVSIAVSDPDSLEHKYVLSDIDAIAVQLKKLQDAHVAILWRPLHEAQGGWFWWGAKGPQPFIQLWQLLYDRLVKVDGVHNLIWVYTSADDPAWYPGDAYVDVVGVDAYPKDLRDAQSELWTRLVADFNGRKPLTLSEFGGVPDIDRMHRLGIDWSYAVSWSNTEGPKKNTPDALKQIYASPVALKLATHTP